MGILSRRLVVVVGVALAGVWGAHVLRADDPPAETTSAKRLRLVAAYRALPRFHERIRATRVSDSEPSSLVIEMYREGDWLGALYTAEPMPAEVTKSRLDVSLGLYSILSNGHETRELWVGTVCTRTKGALAINADSQSFVRAMAVLAKDAVPGLAPLEPYRAELKVKMTPKEEGKSSLSLGWTTERDAVPSWLDPTLWDGADVRDDESGRRVFVRGGSTTWIVRSTDGGLDGFQSRNPFTGDLYEAAVVPVASTPAQWRERIRDVLARDGRLVTFDDGGASVASHVLGDAFSAVRAAQPGVVSDRAKLDLASKALVGAFLEVPSIASKRPLAFETVWGFIRIAVLDAIDADVDEQKIALVSEVFAQQLRAALGAPPASSLPPPKRR